MIHKMRVGEIFLFVAKQNFHDKFPNVVDILDRTKIIIAAVAITYQKLCHRITAMLFSVV